MKVMLLSTKFNSLATVLSNLYHCFDEVAQKTYYYIHALPSDRRPGGHLVVSKSKLGVGACSTFAVLTYACAGAVQDLVLLACSLIKRRRKAKKDGGDYECAVSHAQARW